MTNFIPIFPLDIIVFPGETLNLHIFEPRYKQLVKECLMELKPFGIVPVLDGHTQEFGTLIEVEHLAQEYDNGEMDIRTKGKSVFRVLEVVKELPDKLYSGAIVTYPSNTMELGNERIATVIMDEVKRLYTLMSVEEKLPHAEGAVRAYDIAHFVGLSTIQEYELLGLFTEVQRLEYLRRHLNNMLPVIKELEEMKIRIKRNGHFRNLSLGDFNL